MSYTTNDAVIEFTNRCENAVWSKDIEEAYKIADIYAQQDDMPQAFYWKKMAKAWSNEN